MNELYKTITLDIWSFLTFMLLSGLISFSGAILVASVAKTVIDYFFTKQLQYLTALSKLSTEFNRDEDSLNK